MKQMRGGSWGAMLEDKKGRWDVTHGGVEVGRGEW
jgi:hypothetical protein